MATGLLCADLGEEILLEPTRWMLSCCCWCCTVRYKVCSSSNESLLCKYQRYCGNICTLLWGMFNFIIFWEPSFYCTISFTYKDTKLSLMNHCNFDCVVHFRVLIETGLLPVE